MDRKRKTYSQECKRKILTELMDGKSVTEVCTAYGLAPSTVNDWKAAFRKDGFADTSAMSNRLDALEGRKQDSEDNYRKERTGDRTSKNAKCF